MFVSLESAVNASLAARCWSACAGDFASGGHAHFDRGGVTDIRRGFRASAPRYRPSTAQPAFLRTCARYLEANRRRAAAEEVHEVTPTSGPPAGRVLPFADSRARRHAVRPAHRHGPQSHKVAHRAEVRVERELIADFKRVEA